jgi:uncharacterized membrane protein YtjA (UPF0391 family)
MLRASIGFFVFGLLAFVLGLNNIGGISVEMGRMFLGVFILFALVTFVISLVNGKGPKQLL